MWMMHGNHDEFIEFRWCWCLVCEVFGVGFFFSLESLEIGSRLLVF